MPWLTRTQETDEIDDPVGASWTEWEPLSDNTNFW